MSRLLSRAERTTSSFHRLGEFLIYICVASALITVGCAIGAFVLGNGLLTLKYALFVIGFGLFGLGSLCIQPKSPNRAEERVTIESGQAWEIEDWLHQLPPLRDWQIPFDDRVTRDIKLFATSLIILSISLSLESIGGVGV